MITANPERLKQLNKVNREIRRARRARPPVNLNVTLTPDEANSLIASLEYAAHINAQASGEDYDPFLFGAVKKIKEAVRKG